MDFKICGSGDLLATVGLASFFSKVKRLALRTNANKRGKNRSFVTASPVEDLETIFSFRNDIRFLGFSTSRFLVPV